MNTQATAILYVFCDILTSIHSNSRNRMSFSAFHGAPSIGNKRPMPDVSYRTLKS